MKRENEYLFSYGTLQQEEVQKANFGRILVGKPDILQNYIVGEVRITDERVLMESGKEIHPILRYTGQNTDEVIGTVYEISHKELLQADDYEVKDYKRTWVILKSGQQCWIYSAANTNA